MYADRYAQPTRFNPGGLTAAVAINAGLIAALIFAAPTVLTGSDERRSIPIFDVPIDPPPPPEPQPRAPDAKPTRPTERIDTPVRTVPAPTDTSFTLPDTPPTPPAGPTLGSDPGPVAVDPPKPMALPPLIGPQVDPRYARDFQPVYPAAERRADREGRVTARVLVGIDGRVRQIERVSATSDAFWQVTVDRARRSWRFTPATRGGVPEEAWRTLTLTFVLAD